jgi:hemolysin III
MNRSDRVERNTAASAPDAAPASASTVAAPAAVGATAQSPASGRGSGADPSAASERHDLRQSIEAVVKPRLRGWLHLGAAPLAFVMGLVLLVLTPAQGMRVAVAVYVATTVLLFGVSAAYHLGAGGPRTNAFLHRLDHANIYLFIAGSYTPFAVALSDSGVTALLLGLVWTIAAAGLAVRVVWRGAPRWLLVASYIGLGWVAVFFLPVMWQQLGGLVVVLIGVGGLLYTAGGVVYARKRPNPHPDWFGFHEVFHAFTIAAFLVQYAAIALVVS